MKRLLLLCSLLGLAGASQAICTSSFSYAQVPTGNNLLHVNFTNNSGYGLPFPGQIKDYYLNYGDGSSTSYGVGTSLPAHNYSSPGSYTVWLIVRSVDSASSSIICRDSSAITVTVAYPPCGATISVSGTGATKTFTATNPAATSGISYTWYYGDGTNGSGTPASHTYSSTGTYNVTLISTAPGCSDTNTMSIVVYFPPPPLNCSLLSANFSTVTSTNVVSFTNSSSVASGAYFTSSNWSFGDGTGTTGYNIPSHTYTSTGIFAVKLVMKWNDSLSTTTCRDSITKTVNIASIPAPPNIISGNVIYDSSNGLRYFKVYLIKLDTTTNILSAVDSVTTGSAPAPYYAFGNKMAGSYRVKAVPQGGPLTGTGLIPTYADSSVYWNTARQIAHVGLSSLNNFIYVLQGAVAPGPGFIGGNVALGANKGSTSGAVSNLLVFLRDANMRVIQTALTDANGNYGFSNLKLGPYSIWPEQINYSTMPVTPIVINATYPSKNSIDFNVDDAKHSIAPRTLSVTTVNTEHEYLRVSPVPAHGQVTLSWHATQVQDASFIISNMNGQVVRTTTVMQAKTGSIQLDLNGLAPGVYFVHGSGSLAAHIARLIVQ
ncbi:MAG: PKD domain-containing protein [Bacteroidetes bacterium]|nr:PKD domain-containing protein [Bacteroidota bacterium]MBS1630353.1 PKD domain-containing protein [Bacteroidota bacterium]